MSPNKTKYVSYEFNPPLVHTKNGWRLFYKQYITEWSDFKSWWLDMIHHYKLIEVLDDKHN